MSKKPRTAAEIAKMGLPGLPTTKASILARAEKEGWQYETQIGRGGVRKVFRLPERYTQPTHDVNQDHAPFFLRKEVEQRQHVTAADVAVTDESSVTPTDLAGWGSDFEPDFLTEAIRIMDSWATQTVPTPSLVVRSATYIVIYRLLREGASVQLIKELVDLMSEPHKLPDTL